MIQNQPLVITNHKSYPTKDYLDTLEAIHKISENSHETNEVYRLVISLTKGDRENHLTALQMSEDNTLNIRPSEEEDVCEFRRIYMTPGSLGMGPSSYLFICSILFNVIQLLWLCWQCTKLTE
jgi:hypothetical protein